MANTPDLIVTVKSTGVRSTVISSPGAAAIRLGQLNDVDDTPKANGDVLTWITANGKFEMHPGSGSGTGSANAFGVINVAGQNNIVATITSNILTIIAGSGILVTTNSINSALTITASGGSGLDQFARDNSNGAFTQANTANTTGQAAFDAANNASDSGTEYAMAAGYGMP